MDSPRLLSEGDRAFFARLRRREFARLDAQGLAYLDYTGSALYGESQLAAQHELLRSSCFGNPHSEHRPSRLATETIERARLAVLRFLDVDESTHAVCFTANTSAAIKLVAESYPFSSRTRLLLAADNHNSVNGVREYARRAGADVEYLALDAELRLADPEPAIDRGGPGLVAFPAQSNFSGVRHPLALVERAKARGFDVLLDIAALVASHRFSLRDCPADFAALSFYKLFGFPTGLGALVARREALTRLRRPWFAGGTVNWAAVDPDDHVLRDGPAGFEDGTPNFLGIAALDFGFALLEEAGMRRIQAHVGSLTAGFLDKLAALRHPGGEPMVVIHGPADMESRGGTVAFNLLDEDGGTVPYWLVEESARDAGIAVRGGCFCNPGAAQRALGLATADTTRCLAAIGESFTPELFAECLGQPVGAVRASLGLANNDADCARALALIEAVSGYGEAAARTAPTKSSAASGVRTKRSSPASRSTALRKSLA